jgi:hypothetical protein
MLGMQANFSTGLEIAPVRLLPLFGELDPEQG